MYLFKFFLLALSTIIDCKTPKIEKFTSTWWLLERKKENEREKEKAQAFGGGKSRNLLVTISGN